MSNAEKVAIFLHSGDYDRIHQGLSIAAAAVASGRPTMVLFFWWALDRLAGDQLEPGQADLSRWPETVSERLKEGTFPSAASLLKSAREGGAQIFACTGSLAILGRRPDALEGKVDGFLGWAAILDATRGVTDRFYL